MAYFVVCKFWTLRFEVGTHADFNGLWIYFPFRNWRISKNSGRIYWYGWCISQRGRKGKNEGKDYFCTSIVYICKHALSLLGDGHIIELIKTFFVLFILDIYVSIVSKLHFDFRTPDVIPYGTRTKLQWILRCTIIELTFGLYPSLIITMTLTYFDYDK